MAENDPGENMVLDPIDVGVAVVKSPPTPMHLKASGKRIWKQLWETGQTWLGPSDEPTANVVCEQVDQVADLRRMAAQVNDIELEQKYMYSIQVAETLVMSSLSELGFDPAAQARLGFSIPKVAESNPRPRRRRRR